MLYHFLSNIFVVNHHLLPPPPPPILLFIPTPIETFLYSVCANHYSHHMVPPFLKQAEIRVWLGGWMRHAENPAPSWDSLKRTNPWPGRSLTKKNPGTKPKPGKISNVFEIFALAHRPGSKLSLVYIHLYVCVCVTKKYDSKNL